MLWSQRMQRAAAAALLVTVSGQASAEEFPLTSGPAEDIAPRVAYNSVRDEYLVSSLSDWHAQLSRVGPRGENRGWAPSPFSHQLMTPIAIEYSSTSDSYLVVSCTYNRALFTWHVIGRALDGAGQPIGPEYTYLSFSLLGGSGFHSGEQPGPGRSEGIDPIAIVWNSDANEFLIATRSTEYDVYGQLEAFPIWTRRIAVTGAPMDDANRFDSATGVEKMSLCYVSADGGWYAMANVETISKFSRSGAFLFDLWVDLDNGNKNDVGVTTRLTDIAYSDGELQLVWQDWNNHETYDPAVSRTGVWSTVIDIDRIRDGARVAPLIQPVSWVCSHWLSYWAPQVAFDSFTSSFQTVWRETGADSDACNQGVGMDVRTAERSGNLPWTRTTVSSDLPGDPYADPSHYSPQIAIGGFGRMLVVWDDPRGGDRDIYGAVLAGSGGRADPEVQGWSTPGARDRYPTIEWIESSGYPYLGNSRFTVAARHFSPEIPGQFHIGLQSAEVFEETYRGQGWWRFQEPIAQIPIAYDRRGDFAFPLSIKDSPNLLGLEVYYQFLGFDEYAAGGVSATPALWFRISQ